MIEPASVPAQGQPFLGLWQIEPEVRVDTRGSLSVVEFAERLGFVARRSFVVSFADEAVAEGIARAEHAVSCAQLFLVISGSFRLDLDNGGAQRSLLCSATGPVALVAPGVWRRLRSLEAGGRMLVLADAAFADTCYFPTAMPDLVTRYTARAPR